MSWKIKGMNSFNKHVSEKCIDNPEKISFYKNMMNNARYSSQKLIVAKAYVPEIL